MTDEYVSNSECEKRRKDMNEGVAFMIARLETHDLQAKKILDKTVTICDKMGALEACIERTTTNLDTAARLLADTTSKQNIMTDTMGWMQGEITASRKAVSGIAKYQGVTIRQVMFEIAKIAIVAVSVLGGLKVTGIL